MKNINLNIWKLSGIFVCLGLTLLLIGMFMGANRHIYADTSGIHIVNTKDSSSNKIEELNLDSFKDIDINSSYSSIEFVKSDKYGIEMNFYENTAKPTWSNENGKLKIDYKSIGTGFRFFNLNLDFNFNNMSPNIKIFLPKDALLNSVLIKTSSGSINIGDFKATTLNIDNSYGNVSFSNVKSDDFIVKLSSGKLTLNHCEFSNADLQNSYGNITGNNIKSSKLNVNSSSGSIDLLGEFTGETKLHCSYGSITLNTSKDKDFYNCDISTKYGSIKFDNKKEDNKVVTTSKSNSESILNITAESGNINVGFNK